MANFKITNPQVVGKLKLSAETASRALQVNASGELESSSVTSTELGYLSGVTSAIQTQLGGKASSTDLSNHVNDTNNPHSVTKTQVGLSNVPNVDATARANHTGTQLASTISDFASAAKSAAVADSISDGVTDTAPSQNAVFDALALKADASSLSNYIPTSEKGANNGVATLDAGGKVPVSQLPNSVMEFKGVFDPATATFTDASGNAGDVYLASAAGSYNAGSGSITYAIGDWAVHNGSIFQKSLNSNAVVSVNGQTGVVTLTKSDVGLGNVDNTSDATKNSAVATLTNKTLTAPVINSPTGIVKGDVGLGNVDNVQQLPMSYLDTDDTLAADSDAKVPSQKAVKAYIADQIGASAHAGDIAHTSFAAANNVSSPANVTGLAFAAASVRSFKVQISVSIDATTDLNEVFELTGVQLASGFVMASSSVGDDSGVVFTITSAGQIQYTSQNSAGFVSNTMKFRAQVTDV
jgi:hypothetical protein